MKLVRFVRPLTSVEASESARPEIGVVTGDSVLEVRAAYEHYLRRVESNQRAAQVARTEFGEGMVSFVQSGQTTLNRARTVVEYLMDMDPEKAREDGLRFPRSEVDLTAPLEPLSLRDGLSSETHFSNSLEAVGIDEIPELFYERPFYYRTNPLVVSGHEDWVPWPEWGDRLDYELELACVIGKKGRDIPAAEADQHIMGYTIFNDFSIRDYQSKDMSTMLGPSKCKNFPRSNVLGPCLVTSDEFSPESVRGQARVNGETWSDTDNSDMVYSFPELVEFISRGETLHPGEVIACGTFANGCGLELGKFLDPGDEVELEMEGIGILRNTIGRNDS